MAIEPTWRQAIERVLSASSVPLHYNDIAERIISERLRQNLGATPAATVNAQISASIKNDHHSPFVRVSPGIFALRTHNLEQCSPSDDCFTDESTRHADAGMISDAEPQYEIVTAFGMFWRRDDVSWSSKPRLLGMQGIGTTAVDFCGQLGVYLLYDGREVIYVGRSTHRPIGTRLFEHTIDRLSARWDRFSWFGLLPVSDLGEIRAMPATYVADNLIPALEAILIEALEPRQNRKRGDDLSAVEYIQQVDPDIEKKRVRMTIDAALNKL